MVLSRNSPKKLVLGHFFYGIWVLRLKNRQKKTLINNQSEGGTLFVIEMETLWAGPQSGAWFQPKTFVGGPKLSAGDPGFGYGGGHRASKTSDIMFFSEGIPPENFLNLRGSNFYVQIL